MCAEMSSKPVARVRNLRKRLEKVSRATASDTPRCSGNGFADDGGGIRGAIDADGGIRAGVACGPAAAVFSEHDGGINATTSRITLHS